MMQTIEYDIIKSQNLEVLASAVKTYMRNGWVRRGELLEHKNGYAQEMERDTKKAQEPSKQPNRQRSWVPWPKF